MDNWIHRNIKGDITVWGVIVLFFVISSLTVYSATGSLAYRQMQWNTEYYLVKHVSLLLISIFFLWIAHNIDYRYYIGISKLGLWISVPLLIFTWKYGAFINQASRWLVIPFINKTFQPSDMAQFALITSVSHILAKNQKKIQDPKVFIKIASWCTTICGLIAFTNLSTALIVFFVILVIMFIGQIPVKYISYFVLLGVIAGIFSLFLGQRRSTAINRVKNYVKGSISFQTQQSYVAIASGKLYGKGPGKSLQKNLLPHPYSDFIYSILIEEYGLFGGVFVLILYLLLLYRGIDILQTSKSIFGSLMAIGLSLLIVIQAIVNMAVAVGLFPVTGVTLPFVSMGGTSLLFTGITIGAILSVARGEIANLNTKTPHNQFRKGDNISVSV